MFKRLFTTLMFGCWLLGGCAGAQLVPHVGGGHIQLGDSYMSSMGEARELMLEHCNGRFAYTEQPGGFDFTCASAPRPTAGAALELASR